MEKTKNLLTKIRRKKFYTAIAVIIVLVFASIAVIKFMPKNAGRDDIVVAKEIINVEELTHILEETSELTSAKIHTTGVVDYVDKGVKYINRSDFSMMFKATVRAGIELKDVKITVDDSAKTVNVVIPKSKILETTVDPESIKYFDTGFSAFNPDEKEDAVKAMKLAKEKAEEDAPETGIIELADNNNKNLVKSLLSENVIKKDYKLNVKIGE